MPQLRWGKKTKKLFSSVGQAVDITDFMRFLQFRLDQAGRPVTDLLGTPFPADDGWWRLYWRAFSRQQLPKELPSVGQTDWQRAWHGGKVRHLHSTIFSGTLKANLDTHRDDLLGVWAFGDTKKEWADSYSEWTDLFHDGIFWRIKWEIFVDRSRRVGGHRRPHQWLQPEESVVLAALWVAGRAFEQMVDNDAVSKWDPARETRPT